jgi:hypothetical protein
MNTRYLIETGLRWGKWWGIAGAIGGIVVAGTGTPIIAESGRGNHAPWLFAIWSPLLAGLGAFGGWIVGAIFTLLLPFSGPRPQASRGSRMLLSGVTGALAGGLLGLLITRSVYFLAPALLGLVTGAFAGKEATPGT